MNTSISLYIHIPFCLSKCDYCDFFSVPCSSISDEYIQALCNELSFRLKRLNEVDENIVFSTIYIGGGTPSLLNSDQLKKLFDFIKLKLPVDENAEISIEVNPDDITENLLMQLELCGVNRISCGIQSLNDDSLKCVNRRADKNKVLYAIDLLQSKWKGKISFDLIAGLPFETEKTFLDGLHYIISKNPDHISLYTLTVEEDTPLYKKIDSGLIDYDFDFSDKLWLIGNEMLQAHNYHHYEVSNYAKKGFECKHNMTYWKHGDYIGAGCGATGTVYNNDSVFRWTNKTDINSYIKFWVSFNSDCNFFNLKQFISDEKSFIESEQDFRHITDIEFVTPEDNEFEFFMMSLRTLNGFVDSDYERIFNKKLNSRFLFQIDEWKQKGLARIEKNETFTKYSLNEKGLLFLNKFLEELMM